YWTNPMAVHFAQVKLSTLLLADHRGRVHEGRHALNQAGFVLHSAVHEAHPDIVAMCHAHTVHGVAWAAMGRPLDPITQDAACFSSRSTTVSSRPARTCSSRGDFWWRRLSALLSSPGSTVRRPGSSRRRRCPTLSCQALGLASTS